ncbi:hypothetical protein [Kineococcus indalonis]|uniref:hypothetical protein n=1 Tax=Kineococcus indalonis TaxID=2696566 RepID=UPI001412AC7F|nr:hypothetical protein [Kineococcus indalonis]NAZ85700.1 hypothetical protein [Kineococcus indalonis]
MTVRPVTVDVSLVRPEDRERSADLVDRLREALPDLATVADPGGPVTRTDDGSGLTAHLRVDAEGDAQAERLAREEVVEALGRLGFADTDYTVDVVV